MVHGQAEPSLLARIDRLREELNAQYARFHSENRPMTSRANYDSISLLERELARKLREVSGLDPGYASLRQVSIAEIDSVQAALPERTTLVEYFRTGDEVAAVVVSRRDAKVIHRLGGAGEILRVQARL